MKKQTYTPPKTEILELNYAEPVCQAASGQNETPDYDVITPGAGFFDSIL